jgi:hypothetical protein
MQCLLANRTNSAFELTRNLCGRRLLSRQRFEGFHINLLQARRFILFFGISTPVR